MTRTSTRPTQSAMFQTDDLPLFSNTPARANDERYTPRAAAPKQTTFQSFQEENKRAPIAGIDYDPDSPLCQDDYEYLTGTGSYKPQPSERELSARAQGPEETTERAECLIDELIPYANDPRAASMINTLHNAIAANHAQAAIQPATELLFILTNK